MSRAVTDDTPEGGDAKAGDEPAPRKRYTIEELLDGSDYSAPQPPEEREWIDSPAVGRELI